MNRDIFISYSRKDQDFADKLTQSLEDLGADVWIDKEKISAGEKWSSAIQQALDRSDVMILIISPDSMNSNNVEDEWQYFLDKKKPVIPVLAHATENIHFQLGRIQYIDFHTQAYDVALRQLRGELQRRDVVLKPLPIKQDDVLPPKTSPRSKQQRILEAAMPEQTKKGENTEVWAKISLPGSIGLRGELPAEIASGEVIQQRNVRGSSFTVDFRRNRRGELSPAKLCLEISSEDFDVATVKGKNDFCEDDQVGIELAPDIDSQTVIFTLSPKSGLARVGRSRVIISLHYKDRLIAQTAVSTEIIDSTLRPAYSPKWNYVLAPIVTNDGAIHWTPMVVSSLLSVVLVMGLFLVLIPEDQRRNVLIQIGLLPTVTPTLTLTNTPNPTVTDTADSTITPSLTHTPTTVTSATTEISLTPTASNTLSTLSTPIPTFTPTPTRTPPPNACISSQPKGWVNYVVRSGDTIAYLAAISGTTVNQIVATNCLSAVIIVVGQTLFLPKLPPIPTPPLLGCPPVAVNIGTSQRTPLSQSFYVSCSGDYLLTIRYSNDNNETMGNETFSVSVDNRSFSFTAENTGIGLPEGDGWNIPTIQRAGSIYLGFGTHMISISASGNDGQGIEIWGIHFDLIEDFPTPLPGDMTPSSMPCTGCSTPAPPSPSISISFAGAGDYNASGRAGCAVFINVTVSNIDNVNGRFHVWNAFYPPEGDIWATSTFGAGTSQYEIWFGANQPEYKSHSVWITSDIGGSNRLDGLSCNNLPPGW